MTDAEIALIRETGEFFHVTGRNRQAAIEVGGLDPNKGRDTCAGRDAPNVFLQRFAKGLEYGVVAL